MWGWVPGTQGFGWLGMVHVNSAPNQAILVCHLIRVGYPFYPFIPSIVGPTY